MRLSSMFGKVKLKKNCSASNKITDPQKTQSLNTILEEIIQKYMYFGFNKICKNTLDHDSVREIFKQYLCSEQAKSKKDVQANDAYSEILLSSKNNKIMC